MARKLGPTEYYKTELKSAVVDAEGFKYSPDGKRLFKAPGRLKMCVIPEGVEAICDEAFMGRATYEEIDLPDSIKHIGAYAFSGCHRLKNIRIPDGVNVASRAFDGCTSLPAKYLPQSYRQSLGISLDEDAVADPDDAVDFYNDGSKTSADGKRFFQAPINVTEYSIPEGVEVICAKAFYKIKTLTKVVFPHSAKIVGASAFKDCQQLETVKLNKELKEVSDNAFSGCGNIQHLQLSVKTSIQTGSFGKCDKFTDKSLKLFLENLKENMSVPRLITFLQSNYAISSKKSVLDEVGLTKVMEDYQKKQKKEIAIALRKETANQFFFNSCGGCLFWVVLLVVIWYVVWNYVI